MKINFKSWWYKNCKTQRRRKSKCCDSCPMRKEIEIKEEKLKNIKSVTKKIIKLSDHLYNKKQKLERQGKNINVWALKLNSEEHVSDADK